MDKQENVNKILKKITLADRARVNLSSKYENVLHELIKHFKFESPEYYNGLDKYFSVEYQPSDGIVLGDGDARVYNIYAVLRHIKANGDINSLSELKQFSI